MRRLDSLFWAEIVLLLAAVSTNAMAQSGQLTFLSCVDSEGKGSFAVAFSETPSVVYFRESKLPDGAYSVGNSEIYFEQAIEKETYRTKIDRLSGRFMLGTEKFPLLMHGLCQRVTQRQF